MTEKKRKRYVEKAIVDMLALSRTQTIDRVPWAECRSCKEIVWFGTRDGLLVAYNRDGSDHKCVNP